MASRVMEAWNQVLREAVHADYDTQQFALFQIGLVLQRHNPNVNPDSDVTEETLSRELLRLTLNYERQAAAVEYLAALVEKQPDNADSFLYAMSNARPPSLVEPLITVLTTRGATLDDAAAFQALRALEFCLRDGDTAVQQRLSQAALDDLLAQWATRDDDLVSEKAATLQEQLAEIEH